MSKNITLPQLLCYLDNFIIHKLSISSLFFFFFKKKSKKSLYIYSINLNRNYSLLQWYLKVKKKVMYLSMFFLIVHFVPDFHFFLVITTVHPAECIQCWDTVPVSTASGEEVPRWPITNTSMFCSFENLTI